MTDKTKPHHVEMLDYEGSNLTRCKNKTGGKNNSNIDGFYEDKVSKRQYFV